MDEAKKELIRGWLTKASHDLAAARILGAGDAVILERRIAKFRWPMTKKFSHAIIGSRSLVIEITDRVFLSRSWSDTRHFATMTLNPDPGSF